MKTEKEGRTEKYFCGKKYNEKKTNKQIKKDAAITVSKINTEETNGE